VVCNEIQKLAVLYVGSWNSLGSTFQAIGVAVEMVMQHEQQLMTNRMLMISNIRSKYAAVHQALRTLVHCQSKFVLDLLQDVTLAQVGWMQGM